MGKIASKTKRAAVPQAIAIPPADDREHKQRLELLCAIAEILRDFVPESTEIVVHDLRNLEHSIVGLVNGHVTGRTIGDAILKGPAGDKALAELTRSAASLDEPPARLVRGYTSHTRDGRELRSSSVIIRDSQGRPAAGFCVNGDLSVARTIYRHAQSLLFPGSAAEDDHVDEESEQNTIEELTEEIIRNAIPPGVPIERMRKEEKKAAVAEMSARGIFLIRGSADRVASALGITRFTVYNYLDELSQER